MLNNVLNFIEKQLGEKQDISPFLFLGKNLELSGSMVKDFASKLLKKHNIPKQYLYILPDSGEKIKIKEIKEFISPSNLDCPFDFQIFFIENISRLTISASNSLLKFFEEPGKKNLIFLTNSAENGILDTIISRVKICNLNTKSLNKNSNFYLEQIKLYLEEKNTEILDYFFTNKLEKQDYISFLENLIIFAKNNYIFTEYLEEIEEDIIGVKKNNVLGKYVVDKWLIKI